MLKEYSLNRLLVLLTTTGFLFLMIDSVIEHRGILLQDIAAFIPIGFSALGLVIGAVTAVRWKEKWIKRLHVLLLATFLVAGAGLYFHIVEEDEEELTSAEKRDHEAREKDKPVLAPLSFAGLAVVGLLGTSRKWKAEVL